MEHGAVGAPRDHVHSLSGGLPMKSSVPFPTAVIATRPHRPLPAWTTFPRLGTGVAALVVLVTACGPPPREFASGTAIENVSVVDVASGAVADGRTVVVEGSRIAAVAIPGDLRLGEGVERIDGGGGYLIPGLWDMHVHEFSAFFAPALPLYIANGVTGVRDMWGELPVAADAREAVAAGERVGPRAVVAGNITDGGNPWFPGSVVVDSPERARAAVDSLVGAGAGFIKVYSALEADAFTAIAAQAAARGVDVAGHVPFSVTARQASDAGMRSMTHMFGVVEGCSSNDAEVRSMRADALALRAEGREFADPFFGTDLYRGILDAADDGLCGELLTHLAANGTWLTPTLAVLRTMASLARLRDEDDPRMQYMPQAIVAGWMTPFPGQASDTPEDTETREAFLARQLAVTGMAAAAGVGILAGTDTPNPFVYPGFSIHDELELLVQAGLSPREALAAATAAPAEFLGAADSLGAVVEGKLADLVLLEANPLDEIGNTRRISAVVANGRFFGREALDALLEEVRAERASGQS